MDDTGNILFFIALSVAIRKQQTFCAELQTMMLLSVLQQVSDGMAFVHEQGAIHCDLAARNVLLDANCVAKVTFYVE